MVDIFTVFCSQNFFTTPRGGDGKKEIKEERKKKKKAESTGMNSNEGDGNEGESKPFPSTYHPKTQNKIA